MGVLVDVVGGRKEGRTSASSPNLGRPSLPSWPCPQHQHTRSTLSPLLLTFSARMRSLTCLSSLSAGLPVGSSSQVASASAFDPESGVVYAVVESVSPDGEVDVDIFAVRGHTEQDIEQVSGLSSSYLGGPNVCFD